MIFVDIDGVLANFTRAFSTLIAEYDSTMPIIGPQDTPDWETWGGLMTPDRRKHGWQALKSTLNFWETVPPLAPPQVFRRLAASHKLIPILFVTARITTAGRGVQEQSVRWLEEQGVYDPLVIVAKGDVHIGKTNKVDIARIWHPYFIIEDGPQNALDYAKAGFEVALLDWPYTKEIKAPGIYRCKLAEALAMAGVPEL